MREESSAGFFAEREEEMIESPGVLEIYVDEFTRHITHNGNMSCVGVRNYADGKTVVVRLVWPADNTKFAIEDARDAMSKPEVSGVTAERKRGARKRGVH